MSCCASQRTAQTTATRAGIPPCQGFAAALALRVPPSELEIAAAPWLKWSASYSYITQRLRQQYNSGLLARYAAILIATGHPEAASASWAALDRLTRDCDALEAGDTRIVPSTWDVVRLGEALASAGQSARARKALLLAQRCLRLGMRAVPPGPDGSVRRICNAHDAYVLWQALATTRTPGTHAAQTRAIQAAQLVDAAERPAYLRRMGAAIIANDLTGGRSLLRSAWETARDNLAALEQRPQQAPPSARRLADTQRQRLALTAAATTWWTCDPEGAQAAGITLDTALDMARTLSATPHRIIALGHLAAALLRTGDTRADAVAAEALRAADAPAAAWDYGGPATALTQTAHQFLRAGRADLARPMLRAALPYARQCRSCLDRTDRLAQAGLVLRAAGDIPGSRAALREAWEATSDESDYYSTTVYHRLHALDNLLSGYVSEILP